MCAGRFGSSRFAKNKAFAELPVKKAKGGESLRKKQKASNKELSSKRIMVEHVITQLKNFRILSERYRNRRSRLRFDLIAGLYNYEISQISH
ncbi:MAG: transposase [Pyrinomonadaceae bacterium]|nr:transposase [Pyrinomonadaceae bacterium]